MPFAPPRPHLDPGGPELPIDLRLAQLYFWIFNSLGAKATAM
jgi:hypothetical protein